MAYLRHFPNNTTDAGNQGVPFIPSKAILRIQSVAEQAPLLFNVLISKMFPNYLFRFASYSCSLLITDKTIMVRRFWGLLLAIEKVRHSFELRGGAFITLAVFSNRKLKQSGDAVRQFLYSFFMTA